MIKRLYNYMLMPEIPEEAKEYRYIFVEEGVLATGNSLYESYGSIHKSIQPGDGCVYLVSQDGSAWEFDRSYVDNSGFGFPYWSLTGDVSEVWVSTDIPNQYGTIVFRTNDRGFVEYGFSDGGEDDALSITEFTVPQGFHVAGKWQCIVSGTDSAVASFAWYKNDKLIHTQTGGTESECRPSADVIGAFKYECVITFENGKSVTAGPMTMTVEAYDPGEDPGGGGDPDPGGGGGGGDDETSLVTGIDLHVYPDTVVPGGHATVEVTVNGIGNYNKAFTARLSGHASSGTELFSAGSSCNVWIAEEETAEYVLVTVASVQDPTVTATEMIYIDYSGTEDEGTTQEQLQRAFWNGFASARAYFRGAKVSGSVNIAKDAEPTTKAGQLKRSFWQGFVSALIVAAAKTVDTVAYLYNGVELPALPEWDKETYPYAAIYTNAARTIFKFYCDAAGETVTSSGTVLLMSTDRIMNAENGAWVNGGGGFNYTPIWANHDVFYNTSAGELSGQLFLAASEPVPVHGEQVPDGVLISSDGYILRDCNGVYLIAKEDA